MGELAPISTLRNRTLLLLTMAGQATGDTNYPDFVQTFLIVLKQRKCYIGKKT